MDNELLSNDSHIPPTEKFIRNSLTYGLLSNGVDKFLLQSLQTPVYDMGLINRGRGKLARKFIKFAYKNKDKIKRIPTLNRLAVYIKSKMMKQNLPQTSPDLPILDLSGIMELNDNDFIYQLYDLALGRAPDTNGMINAKRMLILGLPKEALAYTICTSQEFAGRAQVVHLTRYRNRYLLYRFRERIRRLPVIGWFLNLRTLSSRIDQILFRLDELDLSSKDTVSVLETVNQNILNTSKKIDDIAKKIDDTAILITEVVNKTKPLIYGLPGGVTAVQTKDFIYGVPSDEWRLAIYLSSGGILEPGTEKYFRSILKDGMIVVDIGANFGIYTLHALATGCVVYSYEPTPKIYKILLDNIGINGFEPTGRANTFNLAVSDTEGEFDFNIFDISGHNSMFVKSMDAQTIKVKTVSLDLHLSHLNKIDVVKIDVEGAEKLVLKGMKNIIARNHDIKIIMEFAPSNLKHAGVDAMDFIKYIRAIGLDIQTIDERSGEINDVSDEELCGAYSVNVLLQKGPLKTVTRGK